MQAWEERALELQEARAEGKAEGRIEAIREIAKRMIENGSTKEEVLRVLNITPELLKEVL